MSEWQPIETAPKDGTRVVGLGRTKNMGNKLLRACITVHFEDPEESPVGSAGWVWSSPGFFDIFYPTHWMPLPDPPKETNDA